MLQYSFKIHKIFLMSFPNCEKRLLYLQWIGNVYEVQENRSQMFDRYDMSSIGEPIKMVFSGDRNTSRKGSQMNRDVERSKRLLEDSKRKRVVKFYCVWNWGLIQLPLSKYWFVSIFSTLHSPLAWHAYTLRQNDQYCYYPAKEIRIWLIIQFTN